MHLNQEVIEKLKERYAASIHPLIFHRSLEKSKSVGDLFDILESFPKNFPVIWDDESHQWKIVEDIYQFKNFQEKMS